MHISVCIPTFNQGKYLEQCVRSAFTQSIKPSEIIVSNDCSSDDTRNILDTLANEIPILKVIHQEINLGMVSNTNTCLREAKYDIIVKLDSDDYLMPNYIETLSQLLIKFPDAGYAHGAVQEIDEHDNKIKIRRLFRSSGFQNSDEALKASCSGYKVAANIIMFRRAALEKAGYITTEVKFAEDYYLSVQIADAGYGNAYSSEVLSCYRVWADAGNVRQKRKLNEINGIRIILDGPIKSSFLRRNWDTNPIIKKKIQFACNQSDCLDWSIYSEKEKDEIENALHKLSSSKIVKIHMYLYRNKLGSLISVPNHLIRKASQLAKALITIAD